MRDFGEGKWTKSPDGRFRIGMIRRLKRAAKNRPRGGCQKHRAVWCWKCRPKAFWRHHSWAIHPNQRRRPWLGPLKKRLRIYQSRRSSSSEISSIDNESGYEIS
jgi:hypothetical protein